MNGSLELSGLAALQARLKGTQTRLPDAVHKATAEALALVEVAAKKILDDEVYGATHEGEAPDKDATDSLYQSFVHEFNSVARTATEGFLDNKSPHAGFLEFGTDEAGSGEHWVGPVNGSVLHFIGAGGGEIFSKGHMVHGIHPIRFMERAMRENREAIVGIYRKHLKGIL